VCIDFVETPEEHSTALQCSVTNTLCVEQIIGKLLCIKVLLAEVPTGAKTCVQQKNIVGDRVTSCSGTYSNRAVWQL